MSSVGGSVSGRDWSPMVAAKNLAWAAAEPAAVVGRA
jgi:hypothetical protein